MEHDEIEFGRFPDLRSRFGLARSKAYQLIAEGAIKSVVIKKRGARTGIRLIDMQSVRDFLQSNVQ